MSAVLELRIDGIAAGGAGVGRGTDGQVLFVHRAAPGDLLEAVLVERRRRWGRARLERVLEPGPDRREAPCPHYARCGGCTLQHLEYDAQLAAKRALVAAALPRIGGMAVPTGFSIMASPHEFQYRNRASFRLRRLGRSVVAGFHELERPARVLDVDERCHLLEPALAEAWRELRRHWGPGAALLPAGGSLRLTLRATAAGRVTLLVEGGRGNGDADALRRRCAALAAVWHVPAPGEAAVLLGGEREVEETWGEEAVALSGGVFLQVNRRAAALLEGQVLALAGPVAGQRIIDCYCGVGLHARRLARAGARVIGLELDGHAIAQARRLAAGAEFREGLVEALLPGALPAELAILNPPRTGIADAVAAALLREPPERIIYISCDPATLARDLSRLGARFALRSLHCIDLFPQTSHVETVAELACSIT